MDSSVIEIIKRIKGQLSALENFKTISNYIGNFEAIFCQESLEAIKSSPTFSNLITYDKIEDIPFRFEQPSDIVSSFLPALGYLGLLDRRNEFGFGVINSALSYKSPQGVRGINDFVNYQVNECIPKFAIMMLCDSRRMVAKEDIDKKIKPIIESLRSILYNEAVNIMPCARYLEVLQERGNQVLKKLEVKSLSYQEYITFVVDEVRPFVEDNPISHFLAYNISLSKLSLTEREIQKKFNKALDKLLYLGHKLDNIIKSISQIFINPKSLDKRYGYELQETIVSLNLVDRFSNFLAEREQLDEEKEHNLAQNLGYFAPIRSFINELEEPLPLTNLHEFSYSSSDIIALIESFRALGRCHQDLSSQLKAYERILKAEHLKLAGGTYLQLPYLQRVIDSNNQYVLNTFGRQAAETPEFKRLSEKMAARMDPEYTLKLYEKFPQISSFSLSVYDKLHKGSIAKIKDAIIEAISYTMYAIKALSPRHPNMDIALKEINERLNSDEEYTNDLRRRFNKAK